MRNLLLIVIIIFSFLGCTGVEPEDEIIDYTIKNVSSHNVELKVFDAYFDFVYKDTAFLLASNEEFTYQYINLSNRPFSGNCDSAYITFDNTRYLVYIRDDGQDRNILDINSYDGGLVKGDWYQYQYFITDEDYDNAKEIK